MNSDPLLVTQANISGYVSVFITSYYVVFVYLRAPLQKQKVLRSIENYNPVNVQECYLIQFPGQPAIITFTFHKHLSFQTVIFTMINFQHMSL